MKSTPDGKPRVGRPPLGNPEQKSRSLRMDDHRWEIYKDHLGTSWLRKKIDEEEEKLNRDKSNDQ